MRPLSQLCFRHAAIASGSKFDPYLNVDPGTMSPYQHGEVYVTDDGAETDLDLGHYERFTGVASRQSDNVTSGRIYKTIIERERRGDYLGATVQVIPHVTDAIKAFAARGDDDLDFVLCEIAARSAISNRCRSSRHPPAAQRRGAQQRDQHPRDAGAVHRRAGELKTKPTQHSVRELAALACSPTC